MNGHHKQTRINMHYEWQAGPYTRKQKAKLKQKLKGRRRVDGHKYEPDFNTLNGEVDCYE